MHADSRQPGKLPWAQVTTNLIRGDERLPVQQLLQRMHVYCIEKQDTRVEPPCARDTGVALIDLSASNCQSKTGTDAKVGTIVCVDILRAVVNDPQRDPS
jgi:hypothetical protein